MCYYLFVGYALFCFVLFCLYFNLCYYNVLDVSLFPNERENEIVKIWVDEDVGKLWEELQQQKL